MNKTLSVMLLVVSTGIVFVVLSGWGDVLFNPNASPAGYSAAQHAAKPASADATSTSHSLSGKIIRSNPSTEPAADDTQETPDVLEQRYQSLDDNARYPTLESRLTALRELYPYREFSGDDVVDLMSRPNAWQPTSQVPDSLPLTDIQRNDGREFIELNPERLELLLPGDNIELPLERLGMHLKMEVDSREVLPGGGFTLHGRVLGTTELMRVTITQNAGLSIAGIDTPQGHVVLQANDDHGWIAASETLFKQDPHRSDMLLPTE